MNALWRIFLLVLRDQKTALIRGAALSVAVLLAGIALLGLSGWFITAAAAAGLAGVGAVFDVFRPSAMVRFLALGRTAARYGERVLTHDATLRALASIRVRLLEVTAAAPFEKAVRLRGARALNRLMADVDALDGVPLRLVLPIGAGLLAQVLTFAALWWLVDVRIALLVVSGFLAGAGLTFFWSARAAVAPSRRAETAAQAFRTRFIDLIGARSDLAVYGRLTGQAESAAGADARRQEDLLTLDRIERRAGLLLSVTGTLVAAGALGLGMVLAQSGDLSPGLAAIGFFVALALMETVAPLRRATADLGRMMLAARRVGDGLIHTPHTAPVAASLSSGTAWSRDVDALTITDLNFHRPEALRPVLENVSLSLEMGHSLAITGPSGSGKSTLLLLIARLLSPEPGRILLSGTPLEHWVETDLRANVMLVPQRSTLMAGTIADALHLADPEASTEMLWVVLDAVALASVIRAKGGLGFQLGARGEGLSGGEARRLVLARALLRKPKLLLLDEPTEGLDYTTARAVLCGIRSHLPQAAILTASHRAVEIEWADRVLELSGAPK
ncbi:amino acid ABC transporter ATP-binding/permease protein [Hoeflea sp. Naph1]|uniref:amino acid ABC transporter ATP-binding/permease protein n=1 Tax=Hoeflea sp. Naph1 TaxID=3388653 RepID=UPI00398FBF6D